MPAQNNSFWEIHVKYVAIYINNVLVKSLILLNLNLVDTLFIQQGNIESLSVF